MPLCARSSTLLLLFASIAGCGGGEKFAPPPPPSSFQIAVSPMAVAADGQSRVTLTVSGTSHDVTLTASLGSFESSGQSSTVLVGGAGQAVLVACDSRKTSCAGAVRISGRDSAGALGQATVVFTPVERCDNGADDDNNGRIDCLDSACLGEPCQLSPTSTGICDANGTCVCTAGTAELCDDGKDNNCDGQIDCVDPTCAAKACKLPSGLSGVCQSGACACPGTAEACGDGVDNDCDGLVDCDDPDCQPQGNALGGLCDAKGNTCSPPQLTGGKSICSICGGNGGTAQAHEAICGDGHDNDCDGLADCQDPDCANLSCAAGNKTCSPILLQCVCSSTVEICNDHADNDCNNLIDCADPQCANLACGPFGMSCGGGGAAATSCACSGNGGAPEATEASCDDGRDNDCNNLIDCADPGCRPTGGALFGAVCGSHGLRCNATGSCACAGGQDHETSCGDKQDNDCDGLIDCQDPDCAGLSCSAVGGMLCSGGACACPYGSGPETLCGDNIDNDCDGHTDCDDPACNNKQCGAASTQLCIGTPPAAICKDVSSQYSLVLTAPRLIIPADGKVTVDITATLKKDVGGGTLAPQPGQDLSFTSSDAGAPLSTASGTTNGSGVAVTTLTSDLAGGTTTVTASYTIPGTASVITGSLNVTMPVLGTVKYLKQQYAVMGARYSGYQETNLITFQLLDSNGNAYPAGLAVRFTHSAVGGSYIGSILTPCAGGPSNCTEASGVTAADGTVEVLLHAGAVATVVSVSAGASAGGASASGTAGNIAIVGAKASGAHISIDCTPKNVPALIDHDCTNSKYFGTTITCVTNLADRFNNVLGVGTLTTFSSEAGAAGPPAMTPDYNPAQPPSSQVGLGKASDFIAVGGYSLPVDVLALPSSNPPAPKTSFPAEYSLTYTDGCGSRTHNPRDGLNTVIVSAVGEEGFVDGSNGCPADGVYQGPAAGGCGGGKGENFIDLGEPFVDSNDNGVRDANEAYIDANSNGSYDPPNGVWDATTVIWAQTRVVYTGYAAVGRLGGLEAFSRFFSNAVGDGFTPTPTLPASFTLSANQPSTFGVYFVDGNFNRPAPLSSSYSASKVSGSIGTTLAISPSVPDNVSMGFTVQYCPQRNTASLDPGRSKASIAVSGGVVTVAGLDSITSADVGNYLTFSGATHAGNNGIFAIASRVDATTVTINNPQAVDGDTADWINSQSDLSSCSNICQNAPCYVVPHVGGFLYGAPGAVSITGAAMPESGEIVQATGTTANISVPILIGGITN